MFSGPKKKTGPDEEFAKPQVHEDKVFGELEEPVKEYKKIPPRKGAKKTEDIVPKTIGKKKRYRDEDEAEEDEAVQVEEQMPLNKYIAHSGECSRRDAAELVKQGKVKVNGELVLDPGYKVKPDDNVTLVGKKLKPQKGNVYILLNKPKGYITTNEDPQGRKTVMELLQGAGADRIFPVGRLDRDTSGLLLITNDGDLTQKLSHPSFNIKKVYHVTLDKPLTKAHFEKIIEGVELEDGKAIVDEIAYLEAKNELGLEIHSGKNRIVRRIFESLGYVVEKLDRMMYAGLTKKNLPRGKWRHLDAREVVLLKHFKS
ncbi:MAG: pseudouridine synthase [Flavipsychrobacter sp.]|nr:pseudouridine synthase [Flavipsychrobacter sp.]